MPSCQQHWWVDMGGGAWSKLCALRVCDHMLAARASSVMSHGDFVWLALKPAVMRDSSF